MKKHVLAVVLAFVSAFIFGCGEHSLEEILFGESSSSGKEISSSSGMGTSSASGTLQAIVEPLIKTHWHAGPPYNNMLPRDGGVRTAPGCETVAVAQLMKYYNYPKRGIGQSEAYTTTTKGIYVPSVNLEIGYDWDNMLDTYPTGDSSTGQQQNAVATLMHHVAVTLHADFVGGQSSNTGGTRDALIEFFGYDKSMQSHYRSFYSDEEWAAIIKEQIDAGLPVFFHGIRPDNSMSHVIIADGYDATGKIHFNMGYEGGRLDGYYSLNDMPQNLNGFQSIRTNIKPDEGGDGGYEIALEKFNVDKISVSQNEQFTVTEDIFAISYFGGKRFQISIALVDGNDNIVAIIGEIKNNPNWGKEMTINCFMPNTINPGQYRLRELLSDLLMVNGKS